MLKIKSFERNHYEIEPGIYLQEHKRNILIYDLRFIKPNTAYIPINAIHTIEHLFATWLKTECNLKDKVISFNPGGCQTMFYLEIFDDEPFDIKQLIINCIDWCLKQTDVPGATEKECGNYKLHDLFLAQQWLMYFKEVLING